MQTSTTADPSNSNTDALTTQRKCGSGVTAHSNPSSRRASLKRRGRSSNHAISISRIRIFLKSFGNCCGLGDSSRESSSTKPRICLRVLATLPVLAVLHAPIRSLDGHQTETMPTSQSTAYCDGDMQTLLRRCWIDCSPWERRSASTSRQIC